MEEHCGNFIRFSHQDTAIQAVQEPEKISSKIILPAYPNPVCSDWVYLGEKMDVKLYNSTGELILTGEQIDQINVNQLQPGLYLIINDKGQSVKLIIQ